MTSKQWLLPFLMCFPIGWLACSQKKSTLELMKEIPGYPSSSGIAKINNHYYIIGDDANNVLILDSNFNKHDSISLYPFSKQRMPKSVKADLESICQLDTNRLLILGSGSSSPYRNSGWIINYKQKEKQFIHLDTFYHRLPENNIAQINIEGSCIIHNKILLANRGHLDYPKNYLLITQLDFWQHQQIASIAKISIGQSSADTVFKGISGLAYAQKSDQLLLTASTEATHSTTTDGAIGKSYIWIIDDISTKLGWLAINPNRIIDLTKIDRRFENQKIESISIAAESKSSLKLLLVADNDNGNSTVFVLMLIKE